MRLYSQHLLGTVVLSLLVVCIALGGGYQLNEHGARAMGMGGAFVAQASDPSAIFFNPAGLAFQKGLNVMGGATFIIPSTKFKSSNTSIPEVKQESQMYYPPNLYGTYALNDQWVVGLGVFTPYGLGSEWKKDWIGSRLSVKSELMTFYVNPTASYKINDQLSIGAGVSLVYATVKMSNRVPAFSALTPYPLHTTYKIPTATTDGTITLDATSTGFNFDLGAIYKPIEGMSVGFSFRSETKIDFSGTAKFTEIPAASSNLYKDGDGKATLPMPMNIMVGVSYDILPKLTVEADFQFVGWSSYKELTIGLPVGQPDTLIVSANPFIIKPVKQGPITKTKNWDDGYLGRVGAEYRYSQDLTLRAGVIYDIIGQPSSTMEPMLPDADRIDLTLGIGYKINEKISVDLAYMLVLFSERKSYYSDSGTPFYGTYNSNAHLLGIDISYMF